MPACGTHSPRVLPGTGLEPERIDDMAFAAMGRLNWRKQAGGFLVAALAGVATIGVAEAGPRTLLDALRGVDAPQTESAPVIPAQADAQFRIGQLEEQIRALNGRLEELGFQMLQMQEQIRQYQEDNEFRFQSLEGGAPSGDRSSAEPPLAGAGQDFAEIPEPGGLPGVGGDFTGATTPDPAGSPDGVAPAEQTLGTIIFDQQGNLSGVIDGGTNGRNASGEMNVASLSADDPETLYRGAYGYVLAGDYALAEAAFQDYIEIFPDGGQIADAHFWLGESQYSQGSLNEAARTFLDAHQRFPSSDKAPEMLLKLGMSLAGLDNRDTACATYREVLQRYPDASQTVRDRVAGEQRNAGC